MKTTHSLPILSGVILLLPTMASLAHAEGTFLVEDPYDFTSKAIYGANRRVITEPNGYAAVQGSFTIPTVFIPIRNSPSSPTTLYNYAGTNPQFYLGCSQSATADDIEVDAGMQYSWNALPYSYTDSSGNIVNATAPPGWNPFVRTNSSTIQEQSRGSVPRGWRISSQTNSNARRVELRWVAEPIPALQGGGCEGYLEVKAIGSDGSTTGIIQPAPEEMTDPNRLVGSGRIYAGMKEPAQPANPVNDAQRICTTFANMRVKRIVAITQQKGAVTFGRDSNGDSHYEEDGSWLTGCTFSGVSDASNPTNQNANSHAGQVGTWDGNTLIWNNWSTVAIDQSVDTGTGHYPDGRDRTANIFGQFQSNTIGRPYFEFPMPPNSWAVDPTWANDSNPECKQTERADPNSTIATRYDEETVNIWLRNYRDTSGIRVNPGGTSTPSFQGDPG